MKLPQFPLARLNLPKLKQFARINWLPLSGFALFTTVALWFGFTFLADAVYFNDPRHQDQELKGWMTPQYIMMSYELPRDVVIEVLEVSEKPGPGRRMRDVALAQGLTLDELTDKVREAAEEYRDEHEEDEDDDEGEDE